MEAHLVFAHEHQVVVGRQLGDDRSAERALGIACALPPPPVNRWSVVARLAATAQQRDGDESRASDVTHAQLSYEFRPCLVASEPLARAYAACEAMARSHYENFPVASRLLPRAMRPHIAALYAFARVADDIADEGSAPAAYRLEQLAAWRRRLHAAVQVEATAAPSHAQRDDLIIDRGRRTRSDRSTCRSSLFDDLVSAFGQDTMTTRYASWTDVLDYCRRSANPVGRLVLRIAGYP